MAQRSSVDRLPPEARAAVDAAIAAGETLDGMIGLLLDLSDQGKLSQVPSRSALGRYSQRYRELAERQREISSVAKGMARDFGGEDDLQGRLMVQLITSLITRAAMAEAEGEEVQLGTKELLEIAKAAQAAAAAAKIDFERAAKIREDARKEALRQAADAAVTEVKAAGASAETIAMVKRRILGLAE